MSYRIGGDEFVIFIPDSKFTECTNVIDQLKKDIEADNYHIAINFGIPITYAIKITQQILQNLVSVIFDDDDYLYHEFLCCC